MGTVGTWRSTTFFHCWHRCKRQAVRVLRKYPCGLESCRNSCGAVALGRSLQDVPGLSGGAKLTRPFPPWLLPDRLELAGELLKIGLKHVRKLTLIPPSKSTYNLATPKRFTCCPTLTMTLLSKFTHHFSCQTSMMPAGSGAGNCRQPGRQRLSRRHSGLDLGVRLASLLCDDAELVWPFKLVVFLAHELLAQNRVKTHATRDLGEVGGHVAFCGLDGLHKHGMPM